MDRDILAKRPLSTRGHTMQPLRSRPATSSAAEPRRLCLDAAPRSPPWHSCSPSVPAAVDRSRHLPPLRRQPRRRARRRTRPPAAGSRPNIVFILTDDLSWNLINLRSRPTSSQLEQQGETFNHYFVADSLCCPSRSTIFTGLFPHDTKVVTNLPPDGGFQKFQSEGLDQKTYAVALHRAGYTTSMLGKYLNGYGDPHESHHRAGPAGLDRLARQQQHRLRRVQLLPQRQRHLQLLHRTRTTTASTSSTPTPSRSSRAVGGQAVRGRGGDVRAAPAVHARAAQRERLSRAHRAA